MNGITARSLRRRIWTAGERYFIDCFCERVYVVIRGRDLSRMITFRNLFY